MARLIGIRHRRKQTAEQEARPTQLAIKEGGKLTSYTLDDDTAELDFLLHRLPVAWRKLSPDEPVTWFDAEKASGGVRPHHCKWRTVDAKEDASLLKPERLRKVIDKKKRVITQEVTQVPTQFEGLLPDDSVVMVLGGSGDRFAAALARRGEMIERAGGLAAHVFRIPPYALATVRGERDKDDDHLTLIEAYEGNPALFYNLRARDFDLIRVGELLRARQSSQRDRIACQLRLLQGAVGRIFLNPEGHYPEGVIEEQFDELLANDAILQGLIAEEERWGKELKKLVGGLEIFQVLFDSVEGAGERLAASIIASIGDIRRFQVNPDDGRMNELYERSRQLEVRGQFEVDVRQVEAQCTPATSHFDKLRYVAAWQRQHGKAVQAASLEQAIACHRERSKLRRSAESKTLAKLCAFCGVHVLVGGVYGNTPSNKQFPRRRVKQKCNWNPGLRQALYLLGEQFNRRPSSDWGQYLRLAKDRLRIIHPTEEEVEVEEKKGDRTVKVKRKRYTKGHIHKMAMWRTLNRFVRWLGKRWLRYEDGRLSLLPMSPTSPLDSSTPDVPDVDTDGDEGLEAVA